MWTQLSRWSSRDEVPVSRPGELPGVVRAACRRTGFRHRSGARAPSLLNHRGSALRRTQAPTRRTGSSRRAPRWLNRRWSSRDEVPVSRPGELPRALDGGCFSACGVSTSLVAGAPRCSTTGGRRSRGTQAPTRRTGFSRRAPRWLNRRWSSRDVVPVSRPGELPGVLGGGCLSAYGVSTSLVAGAPRCSTTGGRRSGGHKRRLGVPGQRRLPRASSRQVAGVATPLVG